MRGRSIAATLPMASLWPWLIPVPTFLAVATVGLVAKHAWAAAVFFALLMAIVALTGVRWATKLGRVALTVPPAGAIVLSTIGWLLTQRPEAITMGSLAGFAVMMLFMPGRGAGRTELRPRLFHDALPGTRDISVTVDEGGARITNGINKRYASFAELGVATVTRRGEQVALTLQDRFLDPIVEVLVEGPSAYEDARAVCDRIAETHAAQGSTRPLPAGLAREERSLEEWRAGLEALSASGYRSTPIDASTLLDVYDSKAAPIDVRAAAAYLLAVRRDERLSQRLGADTPPLVLVLLSKCSAVSELDADWLREARAFVPKEKSIKTRARVSTETEELDDQDEDSRRANRSREP